MSAYTERIDGHNVYTNLKNTQITLKEVQDLENKTPADIEAVARISQVIENFRLALETGDKNLVSVAWLNEASNSLSHIKTSLTSYHNNRNASYLNSCMDQLDPLLNNAVKINCVRSRGSLKNYTSAVAEYTRVMDEHNEQIYQKAKEFEEQINGLKSQLAEQKKNADASLQSFNNSLDAEKRRLDGFATSYQSQMGNDQTTFINMMDSLKTTFSNSQDERKKAFDAEMDDIKDQKQVIVKNAAEQQRQIREENEQLTDEYKKRFNDYEQEVINVVGVINTNMFSHRYKQVADASRNSARLWHGLAVLLIIGVCGFTIWSFVLDKNNVLSWAGLVARIFTTSTLVTGAAYAARQASKQEKVERYARRIEMELVAIDPFIQTLNSEQQAILKQELARRIFGNYEGLDINSKDESYAALDKLTSIETMVQSMSSIIEKTHGK